MDISTFIKELNDTDRYIKHIYTQGGCYKFHTLLSKLYKNATPYINKQKNHIITKYKGKFYDITGEVTNISNYSKLTIDDIPMVENWSFHKHNMLQLSECPNCEEPLIYK